MTPAIPVLRIHGEPDRPIHILYSQVAQGSKNASLPLLAAAFIPCDTGPVAIKNVPDIADVHLMLDLFQASGAAFTLTNGRFQPASMPTSAIVPPEVFAAFRGGLYWLAVLAQTLGSVSVTFSKEPGCAIGDRSVMSFARMLNGFGFTVVTDTNSLHVNRIGPYRGGHILLNDPGIVVTGAAMILAAANPVDSILEGCSMAPELDDLVGFLKLAGCVITGDRSSCVISGARTWADAEFTCQTDRIALGTYMIAAIVGNGTLKCRKSDMVGLQSLLQLLIRCGVTVDALGLDITVGATNRMRCFDAVLSEYPALPTDLQPLIVLLACACNGTSTIRDTVFPGRTAIVSELEKMGQDAHSTPHGVVVSGRRPMIAAAVRGHDLRCAATLAIAACFARGVTELKEMSLFQRGYERLLQLIQTERKVEMVQE